MKVKPEVVIFDWDDTLAITREAVVDAMNYVLSKYDLPEWEIIKKEKRDPKKSLKENFINFFGENDFKEAYRIYLDFYENNSYKKVKPIDNASEFLNLLSKNNIKICIISNKEKGLLINEVKKCFPEIKFLKILGNGDAKENKPSAEPVFEIMKNFNFELNENNVWLIGDTKQDTDCAINAGCRSILIGKGKFMENDYLIRNKNITIFDSFNDLIKEFNLIIVNYEKKI